MSQPQTKKRSIKKIKNQQRSKQKNNGNIEIVLDIKSDIIETQEPQKLVVPADAFSNFEELKLNTRILSNSENKSALKQKISEINIDDKDEKREKSTNNLESIVVKEEIHETNDNAITRDKIDSNSKEGEPPAFVVSPQNTSVTNKTPSEAQLSKNPVFIIKNLNGRKVTLIPKRSPVVLNKSAVLNNSLVENKQIFANIKDKQLNLYNQEANNKNKTLVLNKIPILPSSVCVNETIVTNPKTKVIEKQLNRTFPLKISKAVSLQNEYTSVTIKNKDNQSFKIFKPISNQNSIKNIPNNYVMKIGELNKSQKYFTSKDIEIKVEKTDNLSDKQPESLNKLSGGKKIEKIDLTEPKGMKNNVEFSKILQALTQGSDKASFSKKKFEERIPIYVDNSTQTENLKIFRDQCIQTEVFTPPPSPSRSSDLLEPDITNLLEYVFNIPKYSSGLDETKKNDLIDMSKNIAIKGKTMGAMQRGEDWVKKQLFFDLKDCATFDTLGNKPIHNAVVDNNLNHLKRQIFCLRLRKFSIDIENNQGLTALQIAVANNCNIEIISTLLNSGAAANMQDNEGNTLIHLAVINSTHTVLELLIKYLVNPITEINRKNDEGLTPLMIAAIDSKPEMVDMLLRNKADPNLRDEKSGRTALFHAVELNSNFVINLLLNHKADPKIRNYFGLTALDAARDLDMQDSKILEAEKEAEIKSTHPSVIVNLSKNNAETKSPAKKPQKRRQSAKKTEDEAKKVKFNMVSTYKTISLNSVKNAVKPTRRGRKKKTDE